MKPRIRLRHGIWCCVSVWPFVCGCGYTPKDAFREWAVILAEKSNKPDTH